MFKKILLALDGSAKAEAAIPWALKYAAPFGTPVVLMRVLDKVYPLEGMPFGAEAGEARAYLDAVAKAFSKEGVPTEITLPIDPVAPSIVGVAQWEKCNLIVMTPRGSSKLVRRIMGGITEQILQTSPVPVLIVRCSGAGAPAPPLPARVLVPVDGLPGGKQVLAWAERLARFHQVPVEILYVRPGGKRSRALRDRRTEEVCRSVARLCALLRKRGIPASYHLELGAPAERILEASRPTDLIVMTTHGYAGLKHLVKGSVAEEVAQGARGPVFIFKHGAGRRGSGEGERSKGATSVRIGTGRTGGAKGNGSPSKA